MRLAAIISGVVLAAVGVGVTVVQRSPTAVGSVAELKAKKPVAGERILLEGWYEAGDSGAGGRLGRHYPNDTTTATNRFHVFAASDGTRYMMDDRNGPEINPRHGGAKGDGLADDTAVLQEAINIAAARGIPTVRIPPGNFLSGPLTYTGTLLIGGLSIVGTPGQRSVLTASGSGTMLSLTAVRDVIIQDLFFNGANTATNAIVLDNCTSVSITRNTFLQPKRALRMIGVQNYRHEISLNEFSDFHEIGIDEDAGSVTLNTIRGNKFDCPNHTNSVAVSVRGGSSKQIIRENVFQSLGSVLYLDGHAGGSQIGQVLAENHIELIYGSIVQLGPNLQVSLAIKGNKVVQNPLLTSSDWVVKDTSGTAIHGFDWSENLLSPDVTKAFSLTNSRVRGWRGAAGPADVADDYQFPPNTPRVWDSPSQRLVSFQSTNFIASGSATNLQMAADLLPNHLELIGNAGSVSVVGLGVYDGTDVTIRNAQTNDVIFSHLLYSIRPGTEERFIYRSGSWSRVREAYLSDLGGTVYGSITVKTNITVDGTSTLTGPVSIGNYLSTFHGMLTGGGYGSTQSVVLRALPGAMLVLQKDTDSYLLIGTNGSTRAERLLVAAAGIELTGGQPSAPPAGSLRLYSTTNGAGKVIAGVVFPDGSTNVFATQP